MNVVDTFCENFSVLYYTILLWHVVGRSVGRSWSPLLYCGGPATGAGISKSRSKRFRIVFRFFLCVGGPPRQAPGSLIHSTSEDNKMTIVFVYVCFFLLLSCTTVPLFDLRHSRAVAIPRSALQDFFEIGIGVDRTFRQWYPSCPVGRVGRGLLWCWTGRLSINASVNSKRLSARREGACKNT